MKRLLYLLFIFFCLNVKAQTIDSLNAKLNLYGLKNQSPVLFLHFDKTIYTNNENVWFTAYLLNCADKQVYKTLSVALINDEDRSVISEDKFVIKNGFSFGNILIPDFIPPGNYSFIATANRIMNGNPEAIFTQPITIKTANQQEFTALLNAIDTSITKQQQKVMLTVKFVNKPGITSNDVINDEATFNVAKPK